MDAISKRSYEIQAQVRHNAEEFRNTLNDLYSWEKEIKDKEQDLQRRAPTADEQQLKTLPVRSHIHAEQQANSKQQQHSSSTPVVMDEKVVPGGSNITATTPTEKSEKPLDVNEEKRKQANEIKERGNKYVKLGEYEKAIHEYTCAIDVFPEDPIFYCNRALCYLKLERYNECIEDCERAIEVDSLAVKAYYRRMQANECLGNHLDALKDCTAVLMIDPKNSEANKSLERINERLRRDVKSAKGPNFTTLRSNMVDILPIEKPPYKRSNKPLRRVPVADIVGPKNNGDNLKISDEDIDKLFNSNCGPFIEVKKGAETTKNSVATKAITSKTSSEKATTKGTATTKNEEDMEIALTIKNNLKNKEADNAEGKGVAKKSTKTHADSTDKIVNTEPKVTTAAKITTTVDNTHEKTPAKVCTSQLDANRPLPPAPTSTAQFYSNWKELSPAQKYLYLKSIEIPHLCKVLGAGFDSDTLTDMLRTLHDFYLPHNESTIAATLLEISKNNQVTILSLLMSTEERKVLSEILNSIKENDANTSVAEQIAKNFNLI